MKRFFAGGITLYILLTACEKKSEVNIPYQGDRIVVNSFIQPDSPIYIRVTKSVPVSVYSEDRFPELTAATVRLLENGVDMGTLDQQLIKGKRYFISPKPAKLGSRYTIEAANTGLSPVNGTDTLPELPKVDSISAQRSANRVFFWLLDEAGEADYYRIRLYKADETAAAAGIIKAKEIVPYRLDPSYNTAFLSELTNSYYNNLLIGDSRFDGKHLQLVLQTKEAMNVKYMIIEVSGLTENAYRYLQTISSQGGISGLIGADPVRVFSNIQNGYGIVAGINTRQLLLKVE